jgi:L-fuconate dehydratase
MKPFTISHLTVRDIRFPTSRHLDGSDAVHHDPDYSCAYVTLTTDAAGLEGHGITFTLGRGTELCVAAVESLKSLVVGKTLDSITNDFRAFWRSLTNESQLRWVGPEKGVLHLATAAIVNAVWDLYAKKEKKPVWKLVADMTPEHLVACVDFRHITDALTPDEALALLKANAAGKAQREAELLQIGLPAYTTSAGWLGYSDDKMRKLLHHYMARGWRRFKMKVGVDIADDVRRARLIREEIGPDGWLMLDANQVWEVDEAIAHMKQLAPFRPLWIEEPTSPDDVLGHAKIARAIAPIGVATGEMCQNRVMFKQFMEAGGMSFCQIDSCRLGGVNEVLAVLLLAAKFRVPVCPHAGGVGLCNYVQHLAAINYIAISPSLEKVVVEYADHLTEHFFDPVVLREGRYRLPTAPGYSITMKPGSLEAHEFPNGREWRSARV